DRAVGRDELIAAVWGRADVADALLAQTVLRIRRTLGDAGAEDSAIRTIARFGYRWVEATRTADATETLSEGAPPADAAMPEAAVTDAAPATAPAAPRAERRFTWPIAAVLVLGLAAAGALHWLGRA